MANKIQLRRDTTANWNNVNPILADGEPGLDITTNQVKYGDGANAWVDLSYASGGGGLTGVDGVVTFPGDLLIGTLWPEGGDKESVVWAKDDTEYLGLWWGGSQTYPENGYGPVAGIMIGNVSATDDFTSNASPEGTNVTIGINDSVGDTLEWIFDRDGNLNAPGIISPGAWSAGQTIKTSMLLPDDLGITNDISTSTGNAFVYSYTPVSSSSYLIVETGGFYGIDGAGIDAFYSNLFVSGSEIAVGQESISTAADQNGRYGTFLPLSGRYTNEDTTAKPVYLQFNQASSDDSVRLNYNGGHGWYLKITEIGR